MAQSLARLWTHLIFSTKNRYPFLSDKVLRAEMHAYLAEVLRNHDCETLIVGGVEDHTHSLFALSRTLPAAFSVSQSNLVDVIRYIEDQEEHHKRVTFQDEYRAFLKAYGIECDERYVWD